MGQKKYMLNEKTGKLHKYNYEHCYFSRYKPYQYKLYETEDEAIIENQYYIGRCKFCFKGK